jgi:hypothetical protein
MLALLCMRGSVIYIQGLLIGVNRTVNSSKQGNMGERVLCKVINKKIR